MQWPLVSTLLLVLLCIPHHAGALPRPGRKPGHKPGRDVDPGIDIDPCARSLDVAIVGAGPSGTYSAYKLRDAGLDIELFEYSNRIGGRLYTSNLPNIPDLNLELGGMRFVDGVHTRLQGLIKELGLTPKVFKEGFGKPGRLRYFLRGQSLTTEEVKTGDVPYQLSPEEKEHQADILSYYLEKLTGYQLTGSTIPREDILSLRLKDGRELYKLTFDEALDLVATPEGKQFAKDMNVFASETSAGTSAVNVFNENLGEFVEDGEVYTLEEGMSSFPQSLAKEFENASDRHTISLNRKLESIQEDAQGQYVLTFTETTTKDGITTAKSNTENVCAKRVVLGMPQFALTQLDWKPLQSGRAREALYAVKPMPASKVFMTFGSPWWLGDDADYPANVTKTDEKFSQMYDWKHSVQSGDYAMIASYADVDKTKYLEGLNSQGTPISGSAPGANKVTDVLEKDLLDHLAQAFGVKRELVLDPKSAISQWWTSYPFGGGWALWIAGYNFDDAKATIHRPSLTDDVFIVGADFGFGSTTSWIEGALETVDDVFDAYFTTA